MRVWKFQREHLAKYGLRISLRDNETGQVQALTCRFCETFSREENIGSKRKRTANIKSFELFRTDVYEQHLKTQHKEKWAEYRSLETIQEMESFFGAPSVPPSETATSTPYYDSSQAFSFNIHKSIVEVIIGDILYDPEDAEASSSRASALSAFKLNEADENEPVFYTATTQSKNIFSLVVRMVAIGMSFKQALRAIQGVVQETSLKIYSGVNEKHICTFVRIASAISLQILSESIDKTTGVSIAFDASTLHNSSYLDTRIRFVLDDTLYDFHLLAIPLLERHSGEYLFEVLEKFLDAWYPKWRNILVAVSTDGARSMTGKYQGCVTRFCNSISHPLIRFWSGFHQLDLVVQEIYGQSFDEAFLETLVLITGYLRRQQDLIAEMKTICPQFSDTRWLSMYKVTSWLQRNRVRLVGHFAEHKPSCAPNTAWWISLSIIDFFADINAVVYYQLQGLTVLASEQKKALQQLVWDLCKTTGMKGPFKNSGLEDVDQETHAIHGSFIFSYQAARKFICGRGFYIFQAMDTIDKNIADSLVNSTARMYVKAADAILDIVCERDNKSERPDELPPILPYDLVRVEDSFFFSLLHQQMARLEKSWAMEDISSLDAEFVALKDKYRTDATIKRIIDYDEGKVDFQSAWSSLRGLYPCLRRYCGELATAFPNTATVEADFSVLNWENDSFRRGSSDFSLEGIVHCQQFYTLLAMK